MVKDPLKLTGNRFVNNKQVLCKIKEKIILSFFRFLLFLKLFLGMGMMWIFEIIAGIFDDHVDESAW